MKTPDLDRHIRRLLDLEDQNYHQEYLAYYAEHLSKDRRLAKAALAVETLRRHFGHLTGPLRNVSDELREQAVFLFKQRDPEGFKYARMRGV